MCLGRCVVHEHVLFPTGVTNYYPSRAYREFSILSKTAVYRREIIKLLDHWGEDVWRRMDAVIYDVYIM